MVQASWGCEFEITVPAGCGPGSTIEIELPLAPEGAVHDALGEPPSELAEQHAKVAAESAAPMDNDDDFKFKRNQRVEVLLTAEPDPIPVLS
jgi:hypothetical protein